MKKRKRGGQPGNRNARKHGLYSNYMSPREIEEFNRLISSGNVDRQIAELRIKINSAIYASPFNRRVLEDAFRLLVKWLRSEYYIDAGEYSTVKKFCWDIITRADAQIAKPDLSLILK